jgi:hypothetical protein
MRGINSVQVVHDGTRWWIANLVWGSRTFDQSDPRELPAGSRVIEWNWYVELTAGGNFRLNGTTRVDSRLKLPSRFWASQKRRTQSVNCHFRHVHSSPHPFYKGSSLFRVGGPHVAARPGALMNGTGGASGLAVDSGVPTTAHLSMRQAPVTS